MSQPFDIKGSTTEALVCGWEVESIVSNRLFTVGEYNVIIKHKDLEIIDYWKKSINENENHVFLTKDNCNRNRSSTCLAQWRYFHSHYLPYVS